MPRHYSNSGPAIDWYKDQMLELIKDPQMRDSVVRYSQMYEKEADERFPGGVHNAPDIINLDASFLKDNIDAAFDAWQTAPWRDEVDFDLFCRYVLPYRVSSEQLVTHWRDSLRREYAPFVEGATDIRDAFSRLMVAVSGKMSYSGTTHYPHLLDVLSIRDIRFAICEQRCIVYADVLRAFGIPAAYDYVPRWANYSTTGHAWISMPALDGKTYTVYEGDTAARSDNFVSTSYFKPLDLPDPDSFPYHLDSLKLPFKVYRRDFSLGADGTSRRDVSAMYGLKTNVRVTPDVPADSVCLYSFVTARDWDFAASGSPDHGDWVFSNLGTPALFLPAEPGPGAWKAVADPFILQGDGTVRNIHPAGGTVKMKLLRKYPLTTHWTNRWCLLKGGVFQASDDSGFSSPVLLDSIADIPSYLNSSHVHVTRPYRYVRFVYPEGAKLQIENLEVSRSGVPLKGETIGNDFSYGPVDYAANHNLPYVSPPKGELWTGLDFGEPVWFDAISYGFKNDDNFISPGDEYELYWWDGWWKSLGRRIAEDRFLVFEDVPEGALFWLRDLTKGKEERPFTYEDGKQIFW